MCDCVCNNKTLKALEERYIRRNGDIHRYFSLSYANWLIIPRTIMMDMPCEWQKKFVELLTELDEQTKWRSKLEVSLFVTAKSGKKFTTLPEHLCNYRHPIHDDYLDNIITKGK